MFGQNKITGPFRNDDGSLLVNSLFFTIQGEGPDQGRPAIFLRLAKCNLRCWFCDTEFERGEQVEFDILCSRIVALSAQHGCELVVITGGEPLLQNIVPLVKFLNSTLGISVSVETAGTVHYPELDDVFCPMRSKGGNLIVCSPKTPKIHPELAKLVGAFKYIVREGEVDKNDGLPIMSTQRIGTYAHLYRQPAGRPIPIWVQPCDEHDEALNKANLRVAVESAMKHGYRLGIQLHKIAELP